MITMKKYGNILYIDHILLYHFLQANQYKEVILFLQVPTVIILDNGQLVQIYQEQIILSM